MRRKKNKFSSFSLSETLRSVIMLVPNIINILSNIAELIHLETRLAGKTLMTLLIFSVIYAVLLVSTWFSLLAILLTYLTVYLQWNIMVALFILLAINLLSLMIIGLIILKIK